MKINRMNQSNETSYLPGKGFGGGAGHDFFEFPTMYSIIKYIVESDLLGPNLFVHLIFIHFYSFIMICLIMAAIFPSRASFSCMVSVVIHTVTYVRYTHSVHQHHSCLYSTSFSQKSISSSFSMICCSLV